MKITIISYTVEGATITANIKLEEGSAAVTKQLVLQDATIQQVANAIKKEARRFLDVLKVADQMNRQNYAGAVFSYDPGTDTLTRI